MYIYMHIYAYTYTYVIIYKYGIDQTYKCIHAGTIVHA